MIIKLILCLNFQLIGISLPANPQDLNGLIEANRQCVEVRSRCLMSVEKVEENGYLYYCGPKFEPV